MENKVRVRIRARQTFSFDQTVELPEDEWAKLKETPEQEIECGDTSPIGDLLDLRDPSNWEEFDDIEIEVVDANGRPVEPADYYGQED